MARSWRTIELGVIFMFPYAWGAWSTGTPAGMSAGILPVFLNGHRDLPEEVRAALEEHREEIHSEADLERLVNDLMLRR